MDHMAKTRATPRFVIRGLEDSPDIWAGEAVISVILLSNLDIGAKDYQKVLLLLREHT